MEWGTPGAKRSALLLALGLLLVSWSIAACGGAPSRSEPIVISTPQPSPPPTSTPTPSPLRIHVSGAVHHPDQVYRLPPGSIVQDAVDAAGGPTEDADLERINLAQELTDQQHVHIPAVDEEDAPPAVSGGEAPQQAAGIVNINTATQAELETLPGIGPVTAGKIIAYREANGPFQRIEDIEEVPGIGPATFEGLRDLVTAG